MGDAAVQITGLGKRYRIGQRERYRSLRDTLSDAVRGPGRAVARALRGVAASPAPGPEFIWALRDLSFDIRRGEIVGIIGHNGAGKSTLLKILSRITEPTTGRVEIHGRVGSLLEVGTGFHPELTGRENVYLNGAILGMRRGEIDRRFQEIVEFSGIEKFIDTPAKHYSSGMYMRLAFAVAAHLEPEILIVDEVLAVGDASFQKKCLGKMGDVARGGRTVLLVSHNMEAISALCSRALWIHSGIKRVEGAADEVVQQYLADHLERAQSAMPLADRRDRGGDGQLRFTGFRLQDVDGRPLNCIGMGETVEFVFSYAVPEGHSAANVSVWFYIVDEFRRRLLILFSGMTGQDFECVPSQGELVCRVPRFPLAPGRYSLELAVGVNGVYADRIQDAAAIEVVTGDYFGTGRPHHGTSLFVCDHSWRLDESAPAHAEACQPRTP